MLLRKFGGQMLLLLLFVLHSSAAATASGLEFRVVQARRGRVGGWEEINDENKKKTSTTGAAGLVLFCLIL